MEKNEELWKHDEDSLMNKNNENIHYKNQKEKNDLDDMHNESGEKVNDYES